MRKKYVCFILAIMTGTMLAGCAAKQEAIDQSINNVVEESTITPEVTAPSNNIDQSEENKESGEGTGTDEVMATNPLSPTVEPTATSTPEPTPTNTPIPTETPTPTNTPIPTNTPTPEPTATPTPTVKPTATPEPTPTNTPTPTVTPKPNYTIDLLNKQMYAKDSVNVRDLPSTDGEKVGSLEANDLVYVTGQCKETGWFQIVYNDGYAYVSNKYLVESLPTPTPVPSTPTPKPNQIMGSAIKPLPNALIVDEYIDEYGDKITVYEDGTRIAISNTYLGIFAFEIGSHTPPKGCEIILYKKASQYTDEGLYKGALYEELLLKWTEETSRDTLIYYMHYNWEPTTNTISSRLINSDGSFNRYSEFIMDGFARNTSGRFGSKWNSETGKSDSYVKYLTFGSSSGNELTITGDEVIYRKDGEIRLFDY